jgi:acetolactate synthase I/II/III large subunit
MSGPTSTSATAAPSSQAAEPATLSSPLGAHGPRLGGHILADALAQQGVDTVFCVPGESYLPLLDGLYNHRDRIGLYVCRQEGGAAFMADAYGKLTGRPGVCLVTRGPGACNASIAVHNAAQDSAPMVLLVGQVGDDCVDREAFQEIDYRQMLGPVAKWVAQIDRIDRIPEYISRAFHVAVSGRPGPVVLALPENILFGSAVVPDALPAHNVQPAPSAQDMQQLVQALAQAQRPLVVVGGRGWTEQAVADLHTFASANQLPVACAFRYQDLFDHQHPCYAGDVGLGINPLLAQRIREADTLLVLGARMGEATTSGFTLLDIPVPRQRLLHVHAGIDELGKIYRAHVAVNASMPHALAALASVRLPSSAWAGQAAQAHAEYTSHATPPTITGPLQMGEVVAQLQQRLPANAIITNGAGNYTIWMHRYFRYRAFHTQLAPTSGCMGYGVPAAVAAQIVHRDRVVLSWNGDGCFLMNGQELATAVRYGLPIVFVVVNNGMYGTIRMHQEKHYPQRVYGTDLHNPDFVALAQAYGAHAERVVHTAEFAPALERALTAGKPALLELVLDPEVITPTQTLSGLRVQHRPLP